MILLCTEDAHELWDVSIDTLKELPIILRFIDERLRPKLAYHRLNYFRMGNVDPEMHFHLMPRYEGERTLCGITIPDRGWPKGPDLTVTLLDEAAHARLLKTLRITLA
jgi:diadenosine tetraphosphate (Ap4A) HIT family hydrolase